MQGSELAIEFISVLGMPPVEFVHVAADLGCRRIGIGLEPIVSAKCYPKWSLRTDAGLRQNMVNALRDCGVSVSLGEVRWSISTLRNLNRTSADHADFTFY